MNTFVCLLRAVNVSGKNILKMEELRAQLQQLPIENVATYIHSGNIVFSSNASATELEDQIQQLIQTTFGLSIDVMVRAKQDFESTLALNPYLQQAEENGSRVYVGILKTPSEISISTTQFAPDIFEIIQNNVYIHLPNGAADTKLTNAYFEKQLKVNCTMRNWNTMQKLKAMLDKISV